MLVCALPQFASLATITHLGTHGEMSRRFGETCRKFSANRTIRLLLIRRAFKEISLTLFVEGTVEEGGGNTGNRRGGKIAPLTPAALRFEGVQVSRSGWRVPLSLLRAVICQCRHFLRRRWRQCSKLEAVIAPYFIASSKQRQRRQHELRGPFLAGIIIIFNGRPNRALCYTTAFFLPSFLFDPTKCPITNEASRFDSAVPRLRRSSFKIHL